jgi:hypothetical protein
MTAVMTSPSSSLRCLPRFGTPRRLERPTLGGAVGKVAEALGKPLMPWQQHVADVALEQDPVTGRLVYREVVLTVPRQSGKTTLLLALLIHRMIAMSGPQVAAFTMQTGLQARMRLRREWHERDLKRSAALRNAYVPSWPTGAEALLFHNGSRLEVVAGTESSGHGSTLDLAVIDEAFDQEDDRLEQALRPATITRPNAQLWWVSTAGKPSNVWFRAKVEAARAVADGSAGLAVFEWSAPDDAAPEDRSVWWDCMPALGIIRPDGSGTSEAAIAEEYVAMTRDGSADGFRRAYLNQWVDARSDGAFDLSQWSRLADPYATPGVAPTFSVAVAPDRMWAAVAAAWRRSDGHTQVTLTEGGYRPDATWVAEHVRRLRERSPNSKVLLDQAARGLVVDADEPSQAEQAQADNFLADAVLASTVRHGDDSAIDMAVRSARWKPTGDTRVLDRKGTKDISPLRAVALAAWGAAHETTGGWMVAL